MPTIVKTGGGGGKLVKRFSAAPTAATKENTIGVVTETPMNGYVLQAEQPAGSEGLVWIKTASASEVGFAVDKEKRVWVYPASVKQYINGTWTGVDAYIYQNVWIQFSTSWNGEIYYRGNEFESITGGLVVHNMSGYTTYGTVTKNANSITCTIVKNGSTAQATSVATKNPIEIKGRSRIDANMLSIAGSGSCRLVVSEKADLSTVTASAEGTTATVLSADVSTLDGSYYVGIRQTASASKNQSCEFDSIVMY